MSYSLNGTAVWIDYQIFTNMTQITTSILYIHRTHRPNKTIHGKSRAIIQLIYCEKRRNNIILTNVRTINSVPFTPQTQSSCIVYAITNTIV